MRKGNITRKLKKKMKKGEKKINCYGGAAIDAGSYGCVFDPALKCATTSATAKAIPNVKYISKLMYKEDAVNELIEIKRVEKIIKTKMPQGSANFFLVSGTYQCDMAGLQGNDLETFNKECNLFTKRGIKKTDVNQFKHKLALINIPYGGLNVDKYVDSLLHINFPKPRLYPAFIDLNNALIKLLVGGIVPLNKSDYIHSDVKSGNIVISTTNGVHARLIDWGLSFENDIKKEMINDQIIDRSIQFNAPFSIIFFNSFIKEWLKVSYAKIKASTAFKETHASQSEILKIVAINLLNETINRKGEGHFEYLTKHILPDIYRIYASRTNANVLSYSTLVYDAFIDYIHAVLIKYVDDSGNFKEIEYFYDIFTHNIDIWGFILSYYPFIEKGISILNKKLIDGLCRIFLRYCFSTEFATKRIPLDELVEDLKSLNDIVSVKTTANTIEQSRKVLNQIQEINPIPRVITVSKLNSSFKTNALATNPTITRTAAPYSYMEPESF